MSIRLLDWLGVGFVCLRDRGILKPEPVEFVQPRVEKTESEDLALPSGANPDAIRGQPGIRGASSASPVFDVESFIHEYYEAWGGTDLDRIMSYYAEDVVLQIPGLLMKGKEAVRDQFARPFTTAFPGNRHLVKNMIFGPGVVNVEFSFEAQHKGPFAGHAATGARVKLPGCGVYEYDSVKRQITAGRIYFDVGTLLQTITDSLLGDRKKAEEALRTNERNLSLITNVIPTFIHVLRSDGSVLYVNQAVLGYTGLTLEDVRKEDYRARFFHPEDVERLREERYEALTRPVPFENEQRLLGKDGKYRWFLIRYNPLLDQRGKIDRWYVAAFDIEDRKRTEWLRAAEMRTLQMIADGASLTDILNHVCASIDAQISPRFTTILLMDADRKRLWPTAGPKVPEEWVRAITPLPVAADSGLCGTAAFLRARVIVPDVAIESVWREEYRALALKNAIRAGWSQPILAKGNEVLGTFAVYSAEPGVPTTEDLALMEAATRLALIAIERQRSQEALRNALQEIQKSESKLRRVIDAIPALAWCSLPDGEIEFLNRGWHEYTGLSPEQPHGWGWQAVFHPEDLPLLMEKWQKMLVSGESGEIEARLRRHDGVYRWFLIRAEPFRDESGKIVRWYGTSTDIDDRKKVEEALRTSERNLSLMINVIPTCIHVLRPDGSVLHANQTVLDLTGLTLEDALKEDYRARIFHPEDVERLREERREALARPVPFENEQRVLWKDGKYRWFLIRYNPLLDAQGKIDRWYVAATDIDDRKRAEDAQARQAGVRADVSAAFSKPAHLGEILRGCTEAIVRHLDAAFARIWMLNKDESMLELQASAGMYTRLDGSYSRIPVGDLKVGLIAREKKAHFTNDVMNDPRVNDKGWARSNGMVAFAGYPLVVEDRLIGVVGLFARRPLSESILHTLASVADTIAQGIERKQAEEALRRSEFYLAEGQRLGHVGSWSFKPDLTCDYWSRELYEIFGFDPGNGIPTIAEYLARIHPQDREIVEATIQRMVVAGEGCDLKKRIIRPDGAQRVIRCVGMPIREQGVVTRFVGTLMDITEQEVLTQELLRREAALQDTRTELERVSRVTIMGELAASIAHEINQPLAGVVTSANAGLNWLAANPPNLARTRETLERILRDGTRGGEVLARIRALLKRTPPVKTLVSVNQILREVLALTAGELRQHQIELALELAHSLPDIRVDSIQLQQVLLNLIKNGIEAMASITNGKRTLRIRSCLDELEGRPAVMVEVTDTGVGLSSSESSRLFEAFHTTKPQGLGMGLWISRSIVENHQGRLTASSNHGPGATFTIKLPAENQA